MGRPNGKKTILVAIELEGYEPALEIAKRLAVALEAEIVLCHVVDLLVALYPDLPPSMFEQINEQVEQASHKALLGIAGRSGIARTLLLRGEPAAQILAAIEEQQPALAVLGTHGRRGIGRLLLGSVAERVLRQSPVPVVTVRPPERTTAGAA